ncbi:coiled-coil domain-containing protein 42 [Agrilus planipennis]|uniref:Coiled-coil domain-containing protein 42 n=1 Tax=Agrilus planipennis TaxID=224129 RepID=A0A1W4WRU3_AGRPL|nr:coiled-coil domain-containing protein 42 [Agrilus planipennis]
MSHLTKKKLMAEMEKYVFPNIPPEKAVGDILTIKRQQKDIKKFTDWDIPRPDPACELVAAKRELYHAEKELEEKRSQVKKLRETMDSKWKDLTEQEQSLRENFIKFNKFIKENYEKKIRAERKMTEEQALQRLRSENIVSLQKQIDELKEVKNNMEEEIKKHAIYEQFLRKVVLESAVFKTDNDIIIRYESLLEAKEELALKQEQELDILENARNEMMKIVDDKKQQILGMTNQLTHLQSRYEIARLKTVEWEVVIARIKNRCLDKNKKIHQIREACWNIYLNMCSRKEIEPEFKKDDIENQLMFIKRTLSELKKIVNIAKKRATKEMNTGKPDTSDAKNK